MSANDNAPVPARFDTVPVEDWLPSDHAWTAPTSGWYSWNGGKPVLLTDDEVRAMGFEP